MTLGCGMTWASAWRLSVGTLTVLPVRPPGEVTPRVAGRAMLLAPLAALPLALLTGAAGWLAGRTHWPAVLTGIIVIGVLALGTRALHLDGLADTVDGLGSGRDRERALEIMRTGDIGPMGVVALLLVLGGQAVAASSLVGSWSDALLLVILIAVSRSSLLIACRAGVPAARPGGLGAMVAGSVGTLPTAAVGLVCSAAVISSAVLAGRPWWLAVIAVVAGALVAYGIVARCVSRLGGITGDVLGATVELTLLTLLLVITV